MQFVPKYRILAFIIKTFLLVLFYPAATIFSFFSNVIVFLFYGQLVLWKHAPMSVPQNSRIGLSSKGFSYRFHHFIFRCHTLFRKLFLLASAVGESTAAKTIIPITMIGSTSGRAVYNRSNAAMITGNNKNQLDNSSTSF